MLVHRHRFSDPNRRFLVFHLSSVELNLVSTELVVFRCIVDHAKHVFKAVSNFAHGPSIFQVKRFVANFYLCIEALTCGIFPSRISLTSCLWATASLRYRHRLKLLFFGEQFPLFGSQYFADGLSYLLRRSTRFFSESLIHKIYQFAITRLLVRQFFERWPLDLS